MKVLHLVSDGTSSFFTEQIEALEATGVECDVVHAIERHQTEEDSTAEKIESDLFGHNLLYYGVTSARFVPRVLRNSFVEDYDVVHVNSGMVAPFAFLQPQRPVVTTFWGSDVLGDRLFGQFSRISKLCARLSDETIVMSEEMKRELGQDANVIPHGVDTEKFAPVPRARACREVGWDAETKHVLFPYDPSNEVKQYPVARSVVDEVDDRVAPDVELEVVYDRPHSTLPLYMNASDALLLTSAREGFPNTVKEALACNLPVVATDVGDIARWVDGVRLANVCRSSAELRETLVRTLRSNRRSDGREVMMELDVENRAERIIDVYEAALGRRDERDERETVELPT